MSNGEKNNHGTVPKRKIALLAAVFLAVGFISGQLADRAQIFRTNVSYDDSSYRANDPRYKYISPLLSCSSPDAAGYKEYSPLETEIADLINKKRYAHTADDISVYFRDLKRGRWVAVNEDTQYFPASLLKVPVMMAYYKLSETQPDILKKTILYDGTFDDNAKETFKPEKFITAGKSYTVDDLINYMIIYSDNNASHLLFNNIDRGYLDDIFTDLGLATPKVRGNIDYMSVKSYSYFFRVLYNATYLDREMSEKAMKILLPPDIPNGLRAGIPSDVLIAQKFGESDIITLDKEEREFHDCGIIYHDKGPYLLCVMTKGKDFSALEQSIQDISRLVYNWVNAPGYAASDINTTTAK